MKQIHTFNEVTLNDNGSRRNTIKRSVEFYPAVNEIDYISTDFTGWEASEHIVVGEDSRNKILPDTKTTLVLGFKTKEPLPPESVSITRTIDGLVPDTKYFFTVYVRNNAVSSTQLIIEDEVVDYTITPFTQRLGAVIETDSEGK